MEPDGLRDVLPKYVRRFRTWQPGEVYDRSKVEATRRELVATGLFEGIQVARGTPESAAPGAQVPVRFTFEEREHRTIGFGARFSTSQGPSGTAFWEHRNAFGAGERVRLELEAGLIEQRFSADLRKPRFQRDDQDLINENEIRRHETDAFRELSLATSLALGRRFDDAWTGSAGGSLELSEIQDNEGERTFLLFGLPGTLTRDTRDDPLDPTEGTRLELAATPYLATIDETAPFVRASAGGSAYYALDEDGRFVLAGRARIGSIVGSETEDIPASKRFYAGGGGSVRGFPFEAVGPLDPQNDPLGGRGLLELGLELRVKITDSIGLVPFVDAGNVYDTPYPDPSVDTPLRYAAGLGVRYYTAIGPLRLDIAVPINDREGVDNTLEFYISLGQSF
jgi:translocation and assembly module TamA